MRPQNEDWLDKKDSGQGANMDIKKYLSNIEGADDIVKQIEAEIGKEYVPRTEFNSKNNELKNLEKQLGDLNANLEGLTKEKATFDQIITELNGKIGKYEIDALKVRIAREKGIPYELAGRLSGTDEKSLREDAETLSKIVGQKSTQPLKATEPSAAKGTTPNNNDAYLALLNGIKGE